MTPWKTKAQLHESHIFQNATVKADDWCQQAIANVKPAYSY